LAFALTMLWLAVRNVPLEEVWATLRTVQPRGIALLFVMNTAAWAVIATRWWLILLGFDYRLPWHKVLRYRLTVFGLSYVTPGPQVGGEVLQIYYPAARHQVPTAVSLAAATVDKSLEFLGNFTFMAVGLVLAITGHDLLGNASIVGLLLLLAMLLVPVGLIVAIWRGRHPFSAVLDRVARLLTPRRRVTLRRMPGLRGLPRLHRFQQTTRHTEELIHWLAHHKPWVFAAAMGVTALAMILLATEFWVMNRVLGIPIGFWPAVSALTLVYFAFLLPVPGGLGAMEAALVAGYTAMGLTSAQALSQALLMRARDITMALIGLSMGGIGLFQRRQLAAAAPPGTVPSPEDLPAALPRTLAPPVPAGAPRPAPDAGSGPRPDPSP
ncbi:MAG: lysylphosphatidylglycerol synthase transmembrane domain-containing protein, partial [Caldilineaceae bacterium]